MNPMNMDSGDDASACADTAVNDHVQRDGNHILFMAPITRSSTFKLITLLRAAEADITNAVEAATAALPKDATSAKYVTLAVHPKDIVLTLTSNGGTIHDAFAVVDVIRSLTVPVHTVIAGYVASACTLISLAGHKRFIHRNASVMVHELRGSNWGKYSALRDRYENLQMMMANLIAYYADNTKLSREELAQIRIGRRPSASPTASWTRSSSPSARAKSHDCEQFYPRLVGAGPIFECTSLLALGYSVV